VRVLKMPCQPPSLRLSCNPGRNDAKISPPIQEGSRRYENLSADVATPQHNQVYWFSD
jgi:hypothetical protein